MGRSPQGLKLLNFRYGCTSCVSVKSRALTKAVFEMTLSRLLLFDAGGNDLATVDLNFDGEGRTDSRAGDDGSANEAVGSAAVLGEVIKRVGARVNDHGVSGGEMVFAAQFFRVGDEFQITCAVGSAEREGPVSVAWKPDDHCREAIAARVPIRKSLRRPGA